MWSTITILAAKYRPQLIGAFFGALAIAAIWITISNALQESYDKGLAEGKRRKQQEWSLFWDHQVEQYEDKLRALNLSAANASEEARTRIAALNGQLDELKQQLLVKPKQTYIYSQENVKVECKDQKGQAVEVHLGNEFSTKWNEINEAGVEK